MSEIRLRTALLGAWQLRGWRIEYSDGRAPSHPFGTRATGLLLYTPEGYMSAGISMPDRARWGAASARHVGADLKAAALDSYFHYQGRFRVEGDTVIHAVSESLNPDFPGSLQVRRIRFIDTELELSAEDTLPGTGVQRLHSLRWARAPA